MPQSERKTNIRIGIAALLVICGLMILYAVTNNRPEMDKLTSVTESNDQVQVTRKKVKFLKFLNGLSGSKTIFGVFVRYSGKNKNKGIEYLRKTYGVSPGILTTQFPSYSANASVWQSFIRETISNWNNGYLVHLIWWEEDNPLISITDFESSGNTTANIINWNDLITEGGYLNTLWKQKLDAIVPYLKQLQIAGVVANCDFFPRSNYNINYIWARRPGINGTQKLFQLTRDYLTEKYNLESLLWTWSLYKGNSEMTGFEEFWPGSNYVDFVSVYLGWCSKGLTTKEYVKLLEMVGDIPISMEWRCTVPTPQMLSAQPRWSWFTVIDDILINTTENPAQTVNMTLNSGYVTTRGNATFFNNKAFN